MIKEQKREKNHCVLGMDLIWFDYAILVVNLQRQADKKLESSECHRALTRVLNFSVSNGVSLKVCKCGNKIRM